MRKSGLTSLALGSALGAVTLLLTGTSITLVTLGWAMAGLERRLWRRNPAAANTTGAP